MLGQLGSNDSNQTHYAETEFFVNEYQKSPNSKNKNKLIYKIIKYSLLVLSWSLIAILSVIYHKSIENLFTTNHRSGPKPSKTWTSHATWGDLIFDEEFDSFNLSRWKHVISAYGGGNWEFQYYTNNRSNSYTKDGFLYIKPTLTNNTFTESGFLESGTLQLWGTGVADLCTTNYDYGCERIGQGASNPVNVIQSARIESSQSFTFKYGKVDTRIQLPQGDWIWPAFWMEPLHNQYGDWPCSGEIDIIECRSNVDLQTDPTFVDGAQIGVSQMASTLHFGPYYGADPWQLAHESYTLSNGLLSDEFHNWTMEWTPSGIIVAIDDIVYFNHSTGTGYWDFGNFDTNDPNSFDPWVSGGGSTDAPFDQEFYFIINVAVGGTGGFFPDGSVSTPGNGLPSYTKPWVDTTTTAMGDFWNARNNWYPTWDPFTNNGENAAFKVDYVRVYSYES